MSVESELQIKALDDILQIFLPHAKDAPIIYACRTEPEVRYVWVGCDEDANAIELIIDPQEKQLTQTLPVTMLLLTSLNKLTVLGELYEFPTFLLQLESLRQLTIANASFSSPPLFEYFPPELSCEINYASSNLLTNEQNCCVAPFCSIQNENIQCANQTMYNCGALPIGVCHIDDLCVETTEAVCLVRDGDWLADETRCLTENSTLANTRADSTESLQLMTFLHRDGDGENSGVPVIAVIILAACMLFFYVVSAVCIVDKFVKRESEAEHIPSDGEGSESMDIVTELFHADVEPSAPIYDSVPNYIYDRVSPIAPPQAYDIIVQNGPASTGEYESADTPLQK